MISDQLNIHILFDLLNFPALVGQWWPLIQADNIYFLGQWLFYGRFSLIYSLKICILSWSNSQIFYKIRVQFDVSYWYISMPEIDHVMTLVDKVAWKSIQ